MLAFAPRPCIAASVMERCTRELRDTARIRGIHLSFRTFESREEALAVLYSGHWAAVTPRALPHEGITDLAKYLGPAAAAAATGTAGAAPELFADRSAPDGGGGGGGAVGDFRLTITPGGGSNEFPLAVRRPVGTAASDTRVAEFGPCSACVSVDAQRLQQVFYNIVMNAIRASTSGSAVLAFAYIVRSGPSDVQFCFGVQDNGHGMDAERAAAIGVEPQQASLLSATSSYHGRAGLGLSFAKVVLSVSRRARIRVARSCLRCVVASVYACVCVCVWVVSMFRGRRPCGAGSFPSFQFPRRVPSSRWRCSSRAPSWAPTTSRAPTAQSSPRSSKCPVRWGRCPQLRRPPYLLPSRQLRWNPCGPMKPRHCSHSSEVAPPSHLPHRQARLQRRRLQSLRQVSPPRLRLPFRAQATQRPRRRPPRHSRRLLRHPSRRPHACQTPQARCACSSWTTTRSCWL
jgi:hypothetical protein